MKDCIIVTSVVQTTSKPLCYFDTRSIYSHQQRFEQTLETIVSIRKYMPNTHILLIECSPPSEWMDILKANVDQFINLEFNDYVNNHMEKGLGEKTLLLTALSNLKEEYGNVYKISGRYVLQESFNKSDWEKTELPTFCKADTNYGIGKSLHTFFYRFPNSKLSLFKELLESFVGGKCIEDYMAESLLNRVTELDKIGILVRWACYSSTPLF